MISARDPGSFGAFYDKVVLMLDTLAGPLLICAALFIAILVNFVFRVQESKNHLGVNPMSFRYAWDYASLQRLKA